MKIDDVITKLNLRQSAFCIEILMQIFKFLRRRCKLSLHFFLYRAPTLERACSQAIEKTQEKAQTVTAKKLEAFDKKRAELEEKEKLIKSKIEELKTKDLYLEAYSRRENINIEESSPSGSREDTEEVLRSFMEGELGYGDARTLEIQRVHRRGKKKSDGEPRPILARFLRSKDCDKILALGHRLKSSNFQMFRDLPQELIRKRNLQMELPSRRQNKITFLIGTTRQALHAR